MPHKHEELLVVVEVVVDAVVVVLHYIFALFVVENVRFFKKVKQKPIK